MCSALELFSGTDIPSVLLKSSPSLSPSTRLCWRQIGQRKAFDADKLQIDVNKCGTCCALNYEQVDFTLTSFSPRTSYPSMKTMF